MFSFSFGDEEVMMVKMLRRGLKSEEMGLFGRGKSRGFKSGWGAEGKVS